MLTVGALALSVGACGKKNGSAASDEEIVYTSSWGADEPQGKLIRSIADDFTKATGTKVDLKFVGRKGTDTLPTEMTAGQGPDLFDTSTDSVGAFVAQKLAAPLDDVLDMEVPGEGKKVRDVLPESVRKASTDDGHVRFMAHTVISTAVWYDASKHAGLAPRTWDEFIDYLDKAKKDGRTPLGQDGTVNFYNAYWFYSALVRSEGAGSLSALGKDPAAWDRPAVLAAARKVEQLADGGYFQKDFMATKYPAAQDAWAQGKYDLNLNGTWLAAETGAKLAKGTEVASFQLPAGGKNSVEVGTSAGASTPRDTTSRRPRSSSPSPCRRSTRRRSPTPRTTSPRARTSPRPATWRECRRTSPRRSTPTGPTTTWPRTRTGGTTSSCRWTTSCSPARSMPRPS